MRKKRLLVVTTAIKLRVSGHPSIPLIGNPRSLVVSHHVEIMVATLAVVEPHSVQIARSFMSWAASVSERVERP